MTKIRHDVARHAARTATYQQDAQCEGWFQMEDSNQKPCHTGHDEELGAGSYQYVPGSLYKNAKVVGGERQAHGKHDDAQDDGLRSAAHPIKKTGYEECQYGNGDNEEGRICRQPSTYPYKWLHGFGFINNGCSIREQPLFVCSCIEFISVLFCRFQSQDRAWS